MIIIIIFVVFHIRIFICIFFFWEFVRHIVDGVVIVEVVVRYNREKQLIILRPEGRLEKERYSNKMFFI